jgi:hypothetical protein
MPMVEPGGSAVKGGAVMGSAHASLGVSETEAVCFAR